MFPSELVDQIIEFTKRAYELSKAHYTELKARGVSDTHFWERNNPPWGSNWPVYNPSEPEGLLLPQDFRSDPVRWFPGNGYDKQYFQVPVDVLEGRRTLEQWIEDDYTEYQAWRQKSIDDAARYAVARKAREQDYYRDLKRKLDSVVE